MYVKHEWTVHPFEAYRKKTQIWSVQPPSSLAVVFWMFALYMWPLCNWLRRPHRNGDEWHKGAVLCGQIFFLIIIHKLSIHYEIWCTDITYVCAHFVLFWCFISSVVLWECGKWIKVTRKLAYAHFATANIHTFLCIHFMHNTDEYQISRQIYVIISQL